MDLWTEAHRVHKNSPMLYDAHSTPIYLMSLFNVLMQIDECKHETREKKAKQENKG